MSSWSVDTNRVALTNVNTLVQNKGGKDEAIADFKDIADVARQSKGDSHIRAKESGGGLVVYGRKSGWRNLFNKTDPSRQLQGAEQVKKSLEHFVKDKSPATKELVADFLSKYTTKDDGSVHKAMTNESIAELADKIDKIENKKAGLQKFGTDLLAGNGLRAFSDNLPALRQFVQLDKDWGKLGLDQHVAYAEFSTGVVLAVIKDIHDGGDIGNAEQVLRSLYDNPIIWMKSEDVGSIFRDFAQHNDRDRLVGALCDWSKDRWFAEGRFDEKQISVSSPYHKAAPIFVSDTDARNELVGFDVANADDKLDKLANAFERHLSAAPGIDPNWSWDYPHRGAGSNCEILLTGFDKMMTAIKMG